MGEAEKDTNRADRRKRREKMNALQDVRNAQAMWERKFAGKREPVNLNSGRRGGLLVRLFKKTAKGAEPRVNRQPAYGH
jgi:hypothetical protein